MGRKVRILVATVARGWDEQNDSLQVESKFQNRELPVLVCREKVSTEF